VDHANQSGLTNRTRGETNISIGTSKNGHEKLEAA
jgi:hypothetical protein